MKRAIPTGGTRFRNDAWFAGFIDGEGCFTGYQSQRYRKPLRPRFKINLHIDDQPILEALAAEFGGTVCSQGREVAAKQWQVTSKAGLVEIINYLERFPLRAKKAKQFVAWREKYGL